MHHMTCSTVYWESKDTQSEAALPRRTTLTASLTAGGATGHDGGGDAAEAEGKTDRRTQDGD